MSSAELASQSKRACIIAAAGCGKTHLIAEAVAKHSARRELILTHTNAGVDVLRRRLRSMKAPATSYDIETLAGWALRYTLAFPLSSGQSVQQPKSEEEWKHAYDSCTRLIGARPVREIIEASYSGVYVDEYIRQSTPRQVLTDKLLKSVPTGRLGAGLAKVAVKYVDAFERPS